MAHKVPDKATKVFTGYISDKKIVIADPGGAARAGLCKILTDMGAKQTNIKLARNYDEAAAAIKELKPHLVLSEFELGRSSGLNLLQEQRSQHPDTVKSLFVLVTGNTSQGAVAQAAEEDVDTYVLKPYTSEILRGSILRAAAAKLYPSDYAKAIEIGKKQLFEGKIAEAQATFEGAIKLDPKPSLAHFYHGQAKLLQKSVDEAQADYLAGLQFNKIHYKCMVGLYELLMEKKNYAEAYDVVKRISRYFPSNPKRMTAVLRLAVMTRSYEDVERYYQIFTGLDQRNEELIKYVCAALVVCGKYYLQTNFPNRALTLFQKSATTASGRTNILREIILALLEHHQAKEASEFLKRFPADTQSGPDYLAMEYAVFDAQVEPSASVDRGRKVLDKGGHDPVTYQILIYRSRQAGLKDHAEQLVQEASKRWADQAGSFVAATPPGVAKDKQ